MAARSVALALAVFALHASAAIAGTASVADGTLSYVANPGEANDLRLSLDGEGNYLVTDLVGATAGPGCAAEDSDTQSVLCPVAGISAIAVDLGDGDDKADAGALDVPVTVHGGPGVDQLMGNATLFGDDGNDFILGSRRGDLISGGPGLDEIDAVRKDTIDCQGDPYEVVRLRETPKLLNCPAAPKFTVTYNRVTVPQLIAGKLRLKIHADGPCAVKFKLVAPKALIRFVHHGGRGNIWATPPPVVEDLYFALGPPEQTLKAFVNGQATATALGRLKHFKLILVVEAYSGQNRATIQTSSVQIG